MLYMGRVQFCQMVWLFVSLKMIIMSVTTVCDRIHENNFNIHIHNMQYPKSSHKAVLLYQRGIEKPILY